MSHMRRRGHRTEAMACLTRQGVPSLRLLVYTRSQGRCWFCGAVVALAEGTMDHRHPVAKGGATEIRNIYWACRPCNTAKGCLDLEAYRASIGGGTFWGEQAWAIPGHLAGSTKDN